MLEQELDICGMHIPYADIADYQVVLREYIYRPSYRESASVKGGFFSLFETTTTRYEFADMIPYASVLIESDRDYKLAVKDAKAFSIKDSIIKDLAHGLLSKVSSRVSRTRYHCKNIAGRCFTTFLEDVPAVLIRSDGKMSDVYKDDEMYPLLGEPIAPVVMNVPALRISTKKEDYLFFGNGIQLDDVYSVYGMLRQKMEELKLEQTRETKGKKTKLPGFVKRFIALSKEKNADEDVLEGQGELKTENKQ